MHISHTLLAFLSIGPAELLFLIPIVAIVMVFGTGMLSIFLNYRKRSELLDRHHKQRMAAIEKGIDLPPLPNDFLREEGEPPEPPPRHGHGTLLTGLIVIAVGVALYIALHFAVPRIDGEGDSALFALIPIGVGLAFLIYYLAVGRRLALAAEEARKTALAKTLSK